MSEALTSFIANQARQAEIEAMRAVIWDREASNRRLSYSARQANKNRAEQCRLLVAYYAEIVESTLHQEYRFNRFINGSISFPQDPEVT